jgi:hypothetical protein
MDEFLTPAETAKIVRKKEQTLAEWRCTGRYPLEWMKIGGRVMYAKKAVLAFIEQSKKAAR